MTETNLIEDLRELTPPDYGWIWLALLGIALVLSGLLLFRRKRAADSATGSIAAATDPWGVTLAELDRLTALLVPARSREYAIRSTEVLRGFIEARYGQRAPTQTTEEFLATASIASWLPSHERTGLSRFLELCDLLKFGRFTASTEELKQLHAAAVAFVISAKPPEPPSGTATEGNP